MGLGGLARRVGGARGLWTSSGEGVRGGVDGMKGALYEDMVQKRLSSQSNRQLSFI